MEGRGTGRRGGGRKRWREEERDGGRERIRKEREGGYGEVKHINKKRVPSPSAAAGDMKKNQIKY